MERTIPTPSDDGIFSAALQSKSRIPAKMSAALCAMSAVLGWLHICLPSPTLSHISYCKHILTKSPRRKKNTINDTNEIQDPKRALHEVSKRPEAYLHFHCPHLGAQQWDYYSLSYLRHLNNV